MAKRTGNKKTSVQRYYAENTGIRALLKEITKGKDTYEFYDIEISGIIIKDCKLIDGKNGMFIGTPSKEVNGEYYPMVYINEKLTDTIVNFLENAEWEETEDTRLEFEKSKSKSKFKSKSKSKSKSKAKDDDDDDDEDDDDEDDDEDDDDYPF